MTKKKKESVWLNRSALCRDMTVHITVEIQTYIPDLIKEGVDGIITSRTISKRMKLQEAAKVADELQEVLDKLGMD